MEGCRVPFGCDFDSRARIFSLRADLFYLVNKRGKPRRRIRYGCSSGEYTFPWLASFVYFHDAVTSRPRLKMLVENTISTPPPEMGLQPLNAILSLSWHPDSRGACRISPLS